MTNALPPYSNPPALAAADACLWDINAKAADLPLYKYRGEVSPGIVDGEGFIGAPHKPGFGYDIDRDAVEDLILRRF